MPPCCAAFSVLVLVCVHEGELVVFCHTETKPIHVPADSLRLWMSLICRLPQQGQRLVHLALLLSRQGFPRRFALLHHLDNFDHNPRTQIEQALRPGRQRLTTERTRLGQALLLQLRNARLAELVPARELLVKTHGQIWVSPWRDASCNEKNTNKS